MSRGSASHGSTPGVSHVWDETDRVAVARLAGLPHMTTARLRSLLRRGRPSDVTEQLAVGATGNVTPPPGVARAWHRRLADHSAERVADELGELGLSVIGPADHDWPAPLRVDPDPPAVLFVCGAISHPSRRVAVVGTRTPTEYGRRLAARFGHGLAGAGVCVVSGLALGIDGAAHRGALSIAGSAPLGVVANGHDRPYPRRHAALWRQVAQHGAVVSEWPPGTPPDAYRFPQRNRIIAAMSEVVVVVESRETGGSLLTARDAAERGVEVMAVPGPPASRASLGTNHLVQEGAGLVLDVDDVLTFLEIDHSRRVTPPSDPRPPPAHDELPVLDAVRPAPITVERLARQLDQPVGSVAMRLARLERSGWVFEVDGWFEALDEWSLLLRSAPGDQGSAS